MPSQALKDGAAQDVVFRVVRCRGFGTLHRGERCRQVAALDVDARQRDGEVGLRRIGGEAVLQQPLGIFQLATLEIERDQRLAGARTPAANAMQVKIELQADCFAGVWAYHADKKWKFMEPGDVEAALQTASAIGDDRLQRQGQGYVVPDSFTHGSAAQRKQWFMTGYQQGTVQACNTFGSGNL